MVTVLLSFDGDDYISINVHHLELPELIESYRQGVRDYKLQSPDKSKSGYKLIDLGQVKWLQVI